MRKIFIFKKISLLFLVIVVFARNSATAQVLWGMTPAGGSNNLGNIFTVNTDGSGFAERYAFNSFGINPDGQKMVDYGDGFLYSVAVMPFAATFGGILYRMHPDGSSYQVIHQFIGCYPKAALVKGPDGYLYGVASPMSGQAIEVLYKIGNFGTGYQEMHTFSGPNGPWPSGNLLYYNGSFYGTAGGFNNNGFLYTIQPDGSGFSVLFQFNGTNGSGPGTLVVIPSILGSFFYGTCSGGGLSGKGTLFRIGTNGNNFQVLYNFVATMGHPAGSLTSIGNMLYGATNHASSNGGLVYSYDIAAASLSVLHLFSDLTNTTAEYLPHASLLNINNILYGSTQYGGNNYRGVLFKMNTDGTGYQVIRHQDQSNGPESSLIYFNYQIYGATTGAGYPSLANGNLYRLNTDGTNFQVVHALGGADGYTPSGSLVHGPDNNLYGLSTYGGSMFNTGVAFRIRTDGSSYQSLQWVSGGSPPIAFPHRSWLLARDNAIYSMINQQTGSAELWKNTPSAPIPFQSILFCAPGCSATGTTGSFIQGNDNYLYALATTLGQLVDSGGIFKLKTDGTAFQLLHTFTGSDGANPQGSLFQASDHYLYGTTQRGGVGGKGVIFRINTDGTNFSVLCNFGNASQDMYGIHPTGSLLEGLDGRLYGTASDGGISGLGTIFVIEKNGKGIAQVVRFNGTNGAFPKGTLIQDKKSGYLYGMTYQGGNFDLGTVFRVSPDGSHFSTLMHFNGANGQRPVGDLVLLSAAGNPLRQANPDPPVTTNVFDNSKETVEVAPNPVHNSFTIQYQTATEEKRCYIITDINGRIIKQNNQQSANRDLYQQVDLSRFPAGIYVIKTSIGKNQFIKKIVKQ